MNRVLGGASSAICGFWLYLAVIDDGWVDISIDVIGALIFGALAIQLFKRPRSDSGNKHTDVG